MQFSRFATDEKPWCVWDWDIKELTTTFLDTFDATYFEYLAYFHAERFEGSDARHVATAIRTTYCHAMETLFALLGATIQAPDCVPGWVLKYHNEGLKEFVAKITKGHRVYSKFPGELLTWKSLAESTLVNISLPDKEKEKRIKTGFGSFWGRLADDFQNSEIRAEYNSIKHGFRVASGGSSISAGEEESPGVPCPPEKMQVVGGSEFGSTFFEPEDLCKHNLRLVRRAMNWDPITLAGRIRLIAISLRNLVSFLSIAHGAEPGSVEFRWPEQLDAFEKVWEGPSLHTSSFATIIQSKDIAPKSRDEILSVYPGHAGEKLSPARE